MSINQVYNVTSTSLPNIPEEQTVESVDKKMTAEEQHKNLVERNTRYIFEQMMNSTRRNTQEALRQIEKQRKEDEDS